MMSNLKEFKGQIVDEFSQRVDQIIDHCFKYWTHTTDIGIRKEEVVQTIPQKMHYTRRIRATNLRTPKQPVTLVDEINCRYDTDKLQNLSDQIEKLKEQVEAVEKRMGNLETKVKNISFDTASALEDIQKQKQSTSLMQHHVNVNAQQLKELREILLSHLEWHEQEDFGKTNLERTKIIQKDEHREQTRTIEEVEVHPPISFEVPQNKPVEPTSKNTNKEEIYSYHEEESNIEGSHVENRQEDEREGELNNFLVNPGEVHYSVDNEEYTNAEKIVQANDDEQYQKDEEPKLSEEPHLTKSSEMEEKTQNVDNTKESGNDHQVELCSNSTPEFKNETKILKVNEQNEKEGEKAETSLVSEEKEDKEHQENTQIKSETHILYQKLTLTEAEWKNYKKKMETKEEQKRNDEIAKFECNKLEQICKDSDSPNNESENSLHGPTKLDFHSNHSEPQNQQDELHCKTPKLTTFYEELRNLDKWIKTSIFNDPLFKERRKLFGAQAITGKSEHHNALAIVYTRKYSIQLQHKLNELFRFIFFYRDSVTQVHFVQFRVIEQALFPTIENYLNERALVPVKNCKLQLQNLPSGKFKISVICEITMEINLNENKYIVEDVRPKSCEKCICQ